MEFLAVRIGTHPPPSPCGRLEDSSLRTQAQEQIRTDTHVWGLPNPTPGAPPDHSAGKFTTSHEASSGLFGDPLLNMSGHPRITRLLKNIYNMKDKDTEKQMGRGT